LIRLADLRRQPRASPEAKKQKKSASNPHLQILSAGKAQSYKTNADNINRRSSVCQGKVEMSPCGQSRNVPFCRGLWELRVKLRVPVKRRRAMLASNPLRNSRPELIATMGKRVSFRRAS
jgi:hypothetical protein